MLDLNPEEIEIYEDGTKQTPNTFKLIQFENRNNASSSTAEIQQKKPRIDPLRPLRLITLVFDNLDLEARATIDLAGLLRKRALPAAGHNFPAAS